MGEQILIIRKRFHWICYSQLFKNNARIGWCLWRSVCFKNICYRDGLFGGTSPNVSCDTESTYHAWFFFISFYYRDGIFSTLISYSATVMEHFLPLHHFTIEHFLPWDHFTIYRDINIFYLDSILLPWWNIFYLGIILPPWWNIFFFFTSFYYRDGTFSTFVSFYYCDGTFLDIILVPWCD